ncbi:hypothetical protein PP336_14485 [Mycobacteroides abscessus]|uniref:hypothetical protein n=1 Tax=Mycobacteroides abscessus TaxID=36809 RepID=UPI00078DF50D|nr:hypothetical protein [Mycobacteroides abscessus]QSM04197.1 hypothetical protein PROPHIGD51-2_59 [Mycobacterium phage prophiGD51-2]AMU55782.1 hypothetical protein A3O02_11845 [Mycobacteroides abscessus]MBE5436458.1 hypothetical protein [Mycobacteroides abscessus]MBN7447544.1 hypothetical protein [Mycobacteroides abscessus subsp. abscessus]MDM1901616.1 hypothetical protein [Mycobacteroides abscessus]
MQNLTTHLRRAVAKRLRYLADRLDDAGAPKTTGMTFTFEPGIGTVVHGVDFHDPNRGRGCRLAYLGDDEYEKAHTEAVNR